ncbi:NAD(P)-dependent alcohol dehydrogenase [Arthrobacter sp. ISL-30]|uniref:NAD(P)-dependent alcohol dehydrogenase n=1 Tax=Arthrobacter sp. ISL-30 TaxID=2819109 RepID=UPI001BE7C565|nr:NAD(P)-dependent alcohol dehydrogenase [Arthrobacter sp. ISL-30]MBT2513933.1 NAD(P)-dependent alcohol dehydrogenase [Arthrobacter sp. ISL-30]
MTPGRPVPPPLAKPLPTADSRQYGAEHLAGAHGSGHFEGAHVSGHLSGAYGATSPESGLVPLTIARREPKPDDVEIAIDFCGLCHSDVHATRGEWRTPDYPLIPGHEIVGRVSRVGSAVNDFSPGDLVGVGCMVDSCRECESCLEGLEQYCEQGNVGTYGARDPRNGNAITQGGYSSSIVVDRRFVLRVPEGLDPAAAAPLLCAGVTTYSPLRHFAVGEGDVVGVVGLGGLGHMAVKIAKAMGAEVTVFTTSNSKISAARDLGADHVLLSTDTDAMDKANRSIDVIIDTVAAPHDLNPYFRTLRRDGALFQLGLPSEAMPPVNPGSLIRRRISYAGSLIGGIAETQEMLDFCAEHGVVSDIEIVKAEQLNEAYDRMVAGDVKYRFVLDNSTLQAPAGKADA